MLNRDPFQRLQRLGWRGVLLTAGCIGIGMLIQMLTGGNMIGGSVAVVFCVGAVMFLFWPKPSILDEPPMPARLLVLAWLFTGLAIAATIGAILIPWKPGADFDILGILFVLTNIIPIGVVCAMLFFGALAVGYWLRFLARQHLADDGGFNHREHRGTEQNAERGTVSGTGGRAGEHGSVSTDQ